MHWLELYDIQSFPLADPETGTGKLRRQLQVSNTSRAEQEGSAGETDPRSPHQVLGTFRGSFADVHEVRLTDGHRALYQRRQCPERE